MSACNCSKVFSCCVVVVVHVVVASLAWYVLYLSFVEIEEKCGRRVVSATNEATSEVEEHPEKYCTSVTETRQQAS